ncbi:PPOX class F420-dependent oxidoreductase [Dermatobacter hominis]|uniref:PPOX class F420-dependent oxidoreductase n=1 Tax=Dermatobacter hominis TaxID=2884263 RepID=UPI001D0F4F65|nr:PPOX class F420-dependent oxidoreductase [Dermatobacter hominis]UDY34690.1 PPOX class F420-dependent oxidoreductase [Dermatobacter hominis]
MEDTTMPLDADLKALAQGKNFAALTTLMPDGQPQTQIMWVGADDDQLIINTTVDRQKFRNVQADPRVAVTVFESDNPYRYVEARGVVARTQDGPPAADSINALSEKYTGGPYGMGPTDVRVILFIDVERVHKNGF